MKEKLIALYDKFISEAGPFVKETCRDFKSVWVMYPNVLIWCAIAFLLALFV